MKKLHRSGEDYLEAILILQKKNGPVRSSDVADFLNVTRPSVSRAISILREDGFILMNGDKTITLTEAGSETAGKVYERHCVLKDWLVTLGVDPEIAERDACGIEHIISRESFERIKLLIKRPAEAE